jgi:hypothetical protein
VGLELHEARSGWSQRRYVVLVRAVWVDPAKRVAGVICPQILPFVDPRVMDLYTKFESGVY